MSTKNMSTKTNAREVQDRYPIEEYVGEGGVRKARVPDPAKVDYATAEMFTAEEFVQVCMTLGLAVPGKAADIRAAIASGVGVCYGLNRYGKPYIRPGKHVAAKREPKLISRAMLK